MAVAAALAGIVRAGATETIAAAAAAAVAAAEANTTATPIPPTATFVAGCCTTVIFSPITAAVANNILVVVPLGQLLIVLLPVVLDPDLPHQEVLELSRLRRHLGELLVPKAIGVGGVELDQGEAEVGDKLVKGVGVKRGATAAVDAGLAARDGAGEAQEEEEERHFLGSYDGGALLIVLLLLIDFGSI